MVQKVNDSRRQKVINRNSEKGKAAVSFRKHTDKRILKGSRICHPEMYHFSRKISLS